MLETLGSFPIAFALLITVLVMGVCADECDVGWFGINCTFQCHCVDGCSLEEELCTCQKGYFGPGCQYMDAAIWDAALTNPKYLLNGSELCNPSSFATSVVFTFFKRVRLSWFRLVVNDASVLKKFEVKLNNISGTCTKERRYIKNNKTIDVTCDTTISVNFLVIEGAVAPNVCHIYISTGRNVALKQGAEQSSTKSPADFNDAKNAVDGNANANNRAGHCSQTEPRMEEPYWKVTLPYPSILNRVLIKSSLFDPEIIGGFTVVTYSSNGSIVERISSPSAEDATENQYDILLYASMPVTTLEIKGSFGTSLSLCEVTVLGDYVCPDYRHGLSCKKHCYCEGHQLCSPISGKCVDGCPTGHYGFGCLGTCNSSCGTDPCLQNSGRCYLCPEGFRGENCNLECHAKTYGRSCEQKCSPNCRDQCDTINGACDCAMGYKHSPRCLACDEGTFGINCAQNCSMNCLDRKCDHVTGECLKCRDNKHGNFCEVCPSGKYGDNCSLNCSQFCVDRICDSVTGFCENCLRGRVGRLCTDCPLNHYGHSCNGTCPKNCESGLCNVTTGLCFSCSSNFIGPTCSSIGGLRSKLMYFSPLLLLTVIPCIVLLWQRNDGKRRRTTVMSSFAVSEEDIYQSDLIDRESV